MKCHIACVILIASMMQFASAQAPQSGLQTFTGIPTFLSAPYQPDRSKIEADIAVIGVPFDEGTWGWPGERYGVRAMREATQDYKQYDLRDGFYILDEDRYILKGKRWVDTGDVEVPPTVPRQTFENLTNAIKAVQTRGAFPLVLGGDHSITTASIKAHPEPLTIAVGTLLKSALHCDCDAALADDPFELQEVELTDDILPGDGVPPHFLPARDPGGRTGEVLQLP